MVWPGCRPRDWWRLPARYPDPQRRFADKYRIAENNRCNDVREICVNGEVRTLYIATLHLSHAEIAIMAMRCGKHMLLEKPHRRTGHRDNRGSRAAEIGGIRHMCSRFGFEARFDPAARLFDRTLASGAVLGIGPWPVSPARLVAGSTLGCAFCYPADIRAVGHVGQPGVHEEAHALLYVVLCGRYHRAMQCLDPAQNEHRRTRRRCHAEAAAFDCPTNGRQTVRPVPPVRS